MTEEIKNEQPEFSLDSLINDLTSLGIEALDVPVALPLQNGGVIVLYFKNISTEKEIESMVAAEEFKGHHWMQRIKAEILSRAVYKINDTALEDSQTVEVQDSVKGVRAALRDKLLTWGPELLQVVWRIYMVHCQQVEDRLLNSFPESATMTDYEKRFFDSSVKMMEELSEELDKEDDEAGE
jgi:hypothetical protein